MHVVIVTDDFPPLIGGVATHAWELAKALACSGTRVSVVTASVALSLHSRLRFPTRTRCDGVTIYHLGAIGFGRRHQWRFATARLLKRLTLGTKTVVHLHSLRSPPIVKPMTGAPVIWTNHTSGFLEKFDDRKWHAELRHIQSHCDFITATSRELLSKSIVLGYSEERATFIPNGVDVERFSPAKERRPASITINGHQISDLDKYCVVVCARRFAHKNGLDIFLDAVDHLDATLRERCLFLFAGNPSHHRDETEYSRALAHRISNSNLNHRLLGPVSNDDMPDLYRVSDLSVLPSLQEATSITGLESMASGLPLIGTDVGGIPDIVIDGKTGLLCPPHDKEALASQLAAVISAPAERQAMGSAARDRAVEEFNWQKIASQYQTVFEAALSQHGE